MFTDNPKLVSNLDLDDLKFEVGHFLIVELPENGYEAWFKITRRTRKRLEVIDLFDVDDIDNIDENDFEKQYVNIISFTDTKTATIAEGVSAYSLTRNFRNHCKKGEYILATPGNVPNRPEAYNICIRL